MNLVHIIKIRSNLNSSINICASGQILDKGKWRLALASKRRIYVQQPGLRESLLGLPKRVRFIGNNHRRTLENILSLAVI